MTNSNIVAESNVFLSREDDPCHDPEFVAQIYDYDRIKGIAERRNVDYRIPTLSKVQSEILKTELRCVYAKNDPCWGYVKSRNRVVSMCINGLCPRIKQCNPNYSSAEAKTWKFSDVDTIAYRDPQKLRMYYLVDMVSDEEMLRYDSNPINEGFEYTIPKSSVLPNTQDGKTKDEKYRIDSKTGRKMVAIGYKWIITDNASYESDELVPIWGYVEEVKPKQKETYASRKKAKKIEKKSDTPQKKIRKIVEPVYNSEFSRKNEFEEAVAAAITDEFRLTDVGPENISNEIDTVVLLDNPAELAFVSGTFLVSKIEHGIATEHSVRLALIDEYPSFADRKVVWLSNTALKRGCKESNVEAWKLLSERHDISQLNVAERDFYQFTYGDQKKRWTCRNMYGVTHVCIEQSDISEMDNLPDGVYPLSLVDDGKTYMVLRKNAELLGRLGNTFVELIDALKNSGEISSLPATISISLQVQNGKAEFLGMGHLKFIEY